MEVEIPASDVQKIEQALDKMMDNIVDDIFNASQRNLIANGSVDTGTLFKTGNIVRKFLEKEIVYPAEYSEAVEYGRLPGNYVSIQPLQEWVQRKLGIKNDNESKRVAYAISNAIKNRGISPAPYLRPAMEDTIARFEE